MQSMTWEFFTTYGDEAYVLLATEWTAATGQSPSRMAGDSSLPTSPTSE